MAEQARHNTGHNTVWRCERDVCRMVADIYDPEAALHYRDLLNVVAAGYCPEVRFEVVVDAGFWKGGARPKATGHEVNGKPEPYQRAGWVVSMRSD